MLPEEVRKVITYLSKLSGETQVPLVGVIRLSSGRGSDDRGEEEVIPAIEGSSWWVDLEGSPMFVQKFDFTRHSALYFPDEVDDNGFRLVEIYDSCDYQLKYTFKVSDRKN